MKNRLHYSKLALNDLDEIWDYLVTEGCSLDIVENVVNKILDTTALLENFAELGARLGNDNFETDYRYIIVNKYFVFYRVVGKTIHIDRIISSRRDFMRILFGQS